MTDKPETGSEVDPKDATFWLAEIEAAKQRSADWYEKAEEAQDVYDDDKARAFGGLNLFWANVETQKSAIGEDFGKPQVTRVNQPENDGGLSRHIATIWEKSIAAAVRETNDNHDIGLAVNDVFVPGRGQVWLDLEAKEDDEGNVTWASAPLVRVNYKDFLHGSAARWGDVPWVARAHLFTKDELVSVCGMSEEKADDVPLNVSLPDENRKDRSKPSKGQEQFRRARVWEIWTKFPSKLRLYVAEDYEDGVLCHDPDPYRLKHFFPCPRPIRANGDEGREPITDYSRCEDQFKELTELSQRIFVLTAVLRRRGVHDKKFKEMADLAAAEDNVSLAVENWAELQQKGGLTAVMQWEDLTPIVLVLAELHKQRRELIELVYQLTGISDLARGMTDPGETLGAQKLKVSFGSGRFRSRETDARRFAAEAYQIKGEVIAEHFPRQQLQEMSGIQLPLQAEVDKAKKQLQEIMGQYQAAQQAGIQLPPPNQEQIAYLQRVSQTRFTWEAVSKVLRSDYRRCYSTEVETDQSQYVDAEADKKARSEFFQMTMGALNQIAPLLAGNPKNGEVFKQLFMFVISAFKSGRSQEEGLERAMDEAIKLAAQQQAQPQQDPKAGENAVKLQIAQTNLQSAQVKLQGAQQASGADSQKKLIEAQTASQIAQAKVQEAAGKVQVQSEANAAKREGQQIDNVGKVEKLEFERATRASAAEAILTGPTQAPTNGAA